MENNLALAVPNPGARPSAPDYRASIIAAAVAAVAQPNVAVPYETDFGKLGGPLMQNQTPACVSHDAAQRIKLWWFLKTGKIVDFSPRFLHILSGLPQYNGGWAANPTDGRDPVTVMKVAQKYGCATEATIPNNTSLSDADYFNASAVTQASLTEALQYQIPGYVFYASPTQAQVRALIAAHGAAGLLMTIGPEFWQSAAGVNSWAQADIDPVRAPKGIADEVGGHELTGIGWNDSDLDRFMNQWGNTWADGGYANYVFNEWTAYLTEAIAIADVPAAALELVADLPNPSEFRHDFMVQIPLGATSPEVRALQIALAIDGDFTYPEITGTYGDITRQAVLAFQKKYQVAPPATLAALNGRNVGPSTLAQLNKLYNHN
jgi:hypothetical protein